eukprot:Phypoly_transcript_05116.p1 GENE.Phypoly_transcript_05116~~Phypoly_transcript_05116.p1  ORF type:complete len:656 (+),score=104.76 Phypoly_transcript_05116:140-1969(+)
MEHKNILCQKFDILFCCPGAHRKAPIPNCNYSHGEGVIDFTEFAIPTDVAILVVFSLGFESLFNNLSASDYSYAHVLKNEAPILKTRIDNIKLPIFFVGVDFHDQGQKAISQKQIDALHKLIPSAKFLKYKYNSTPDETYNFFAEIAKKHKTIGANATRIDGDSCLVVKRGNLEDLKRLVESGKFNPDARDAVKNSPFQIIEKSTEPHEKKAEKLEYLISMAKFPDDLTLLDACRASGVALKKFTDALLYYIREKKDLKGKWEKIFDFYVKSNKGAWEGANEDMIEIVKYAGKAGLYEKDKYEYTFLVLWSFGRNLFPLFRFLLRDEFVEDKEQIIIFFDRALADLQRLILFFKEAEGLLPMDLLKKRTWAFPSRCISFLFQEKHCCYGVPPLTHLCIDVLLATPSLKKQLYDLPSFMTHYLVQDEFCAWEWTQALPPGPKQTARHILSDLSKSELHFNCGSHIKIEFIHGYKSRERYGGKVVALDGNFTLTLNKPTSFRVIMDVEGYLFLNSDLTEGFMVKNKPEQFFLSQGTQMDSFHCYSFIEYMEQQGIKKDEFYLFMIVLYNWIHYGKNANDILYPERLSASTMREKGVGPPPWLTLAIKKSAE